MKAVRLHGVGDLQTHEESVPVNGAGEKLIRVKSVGICGSDLHWFTEGGIGDATLKRPLVLGHEFAGETEDGQRVAVEPAVHCGKCEFCLQGHPNLCPHVVFAGHGVQDGALRECIAWTEHNLFPIPDSFTYADGVMLEPLGVAIHSVDLGKLKTGMTVGVFGCGPIGLLIIQLARHMGATNIIATDILPHRVDAAKSLGAYQALLAGNNSELEEIRAATQGRGIDVVFEAAGEQEAVDAAFEAAIPGGKVILVGIPGNDQTSFNAGTARRKGLTIKMVRRMKHTYPRAIDLV
ncbi:MAG TPA: zinc-binding dehydrogenase, partial [Anaerolineales bacterium]|nr:zinc-binding dehydrogenase [Anaerolineales bacterium]